MSNNRFSKKKKNSKNKESELNSQNLKSLTRLEVVQGNMPLITIKMLGQINNNLVTLTTIIKNYILENKK